jgi:hypothetical protein
MKLITSRAVVIVLILAGRGATQAQDSSDMYENVYGKPVDVRVRELALGAVPYLGRPVRTKGRVEIDSTTSGRRYLLEDEGFRIVIVPRAEIASAFEFEGIMLMGSRVEIVGMFESGTTETLPMFESSGRLDFWRWTVLPGEDQKADRTLTVTLDEIGARHDRFRGRLVRVVGEFRGRNLYGDLPAKSLRDSTDWVIRDGSSAAWITGRKPQGRGWSLQADSKKDTGKWIMVTGRVDVSQGIVYLRPSHLALTPMPRRRAPQETPASVDPPARPQAPPVVVFALPMDRETNLPTATAFTLQFSKDMDAQSFKGRVLMRYAGAHRPGDRPFEFLTMHYDEGRRALRIDPGDALRSGRDVELLLLPGIQDKEGMELMSRSGRAVDGAVVDILTFGIGS